MESEHRAMKMEFWAIVDFNWTWEEIADLVRWCKAFEDLHLRR